MTSFLLGIAIATATVSWLLSFGSTWLARRTDAIDKPTGGRKIHDRATPLLGGLGIGCVIMLGIGIGLTLGWFPTEEIKPVQLYGFMGALAVLMLIGFLDDKLDLAPGRRLFCYVLACFIVVLTGTSITHVTQLGGSGSFSLAWGNIGFFSFPADLLTLAWLLSVTIATKYLDGLDGLVTGQTVIGAGLIAALSLSPAYYQPPVAVLAILCGGAYAGFLPRNLHPAKQFLGEAGSAIAGFSLGFLAIVSGAKVAVALMALGLPLADAVFVTIGRFLRGVSPMRGDQTHIHHRLLQAGLSQRQTVAVLWAIALLFGAAALTLQTRGKLFLLAALLILTVFLSSLASFIAKKQQRHDQ